MLDPSRMFFQMYVCLNIHPVNLEGNNMLPPNVSFNPEYMDLHMKRLQTLITTVLIQPVPVNAEQTVHGTR